MCYRRLTLSGAMIGIVAITLALPSIAFAHDRRPVGGKYQFVVGFLTEPAFAGQTNGIDVKVTTAADQKPVEGLEKTLKAEVIVGGGARKMPVEMQARFGQPGAYAGYFVPTRDGAYIFHFTGTIEGVAVDERFESGPGRFNDVQSPQALQFPDKLPDPLAAANELRAAQSEAATAKLLAIAGLLLGAIGIAVGGLAIRRRSGSSSLDGARELG